MSKVKFARGMSEAQALQGLNKDGNVLPAGSIMFTTEGNIYVKEENGTIKPYGGDSGDVMEADRTTVVSVGNLANKTTITEGASALTILEKILFATYYPYIKQAPSANIQYTSIADYDAETNNATIPNGYVNSETRYVIADGTVKVRCITSISRVTKPLIVGCENRTNITGGSASAFNIDNSASTPANDTSDFVTVSNVQTYTVSTASKSHTVGNATFNSDSTIIKDSEGENATKYGLNDKNTKETAVANLSNLSDNTTYFEGNDTDGYTIKSITVTPTAIGDRSVDVYGYLPIYVNKGINIDVDNVVSNILSESKRKLVKSANINYVVLDNNAISPTNTNIRIVDPEYTFQTETNANINLVLYLNCPSIDRYENSNKYWEIYLPESLAIVQDYLYDSMSRAYVKQDNVLWTKATEVTTINGKRYYRWFYPYDVSLPAYQKALVIKKVSNS